jgi:hypothetical protein
VTAMGEWWLMSTADKLRALGYTHGANGRGYEHSIYRDCAEVFRGTAHDVEAWLTETGQQPEERAP